MLEVIGAGFGRTGTLSLKTALERLGFGPCYHAVEFLRHPEHRARWEPAFNGNADWDEVFAGYRATVDFPGAAFWRELADTYPNARVILTVRDPQQWYASVRDTFLAEAGPGGEPPFLADAGLPAEQPGWFGQMMETMRDEQAAIAEFERHIEEVRGHVPSQRLLVYEVTQGWGPLCEFLGVEVPQDEPFPRLNDSDSFKELIPRMVGNDDAPPE